MIAAKHIGEENVLLIKDSEGERNRDDGRSIFLMALREAMTRLQ
jgi:hypothetical protein